MSNLIQLQNCPLLSLSARSLLSVCAYEWMDVQLLGMWVTNHEETIDELLYYGIGEYGNEEGLLVFYTGNTKNVPSLPISRLWESIREKLFFTNAGKDLLIENSVNCKSFHKYKQSSIFKSDLESGKLSKKGAQMLLYGQVKREETDTRRRINVPDNHDTQVNELDLDLKSKEFISKDVTEWSGKDLMGFFVSVYSEFNDGPPRKPSLEEVQILGKYMKGIGPVSARALIELYVKNTAKFPRQSIKDFVYGRTQDFLIAYLRDGKWPNAYGGSDAKKAELTRDW